MKKVLQAAQITEKDRSKTMTEFWLKWQKYGNLEEYHKHFVKKKIYIFKKPTLFGSKIDETIENVSINLDEIDFIIVVVLFLENHEQTCWLILKIGK